MDWASILAVTDGAAGSDAAMVAAIDLGQRFGARVDFLHVANDPRDLMPYVGEGMSGTAMEQIMASVDASNAKRSEAIEASYKRLCSGAGLPEVQPEELVEAGQFAVCLDKVTGRQPEEIERRGRLVDLVVMPHPALIDGDESASMDAALFGSGRPVLVAPADLKSGFGNKVAIAWDGSREGAAATTAALPLLKQASEVVIITAREDEDVMEPSSLARYLAGHGVKGKTWAYTPGSESIAEGLLDQADHAGADCLVMGAYGHSRLRERILGGATEGILENAKIAVLMKH
ncbi:universal stress protein [Pelagibius marinus]|uniref:universal stress protein n=1 Tax=Pelagibius marinus TaxID=2762760 RepID=UPI0018724B19|nr:universal stress protein [Pelagibius marinus]